MKFLEELSRIESVGAKNKGKQEDKVGEEYKTVGKIGEGTFSDVLKTLSLRDGKYYACKHMKQHFESMERVNNLREIQVLRKLSPHPSILTLHEVVFFLICFFGDKKAGSLSLICELMDMNIYELIKGRRKPLPGKKNKNYVYQLCKSLDYTHCCCLTMKWDVKPESILIKQNALKLGDFGSCRSTYSEQPHTEYISTPWYRAPECLLTNGYYSYKIDTWSAGCFFCEITRYSPLFPGSNELDQILKIHDIIGTPANRLNKFKQSRIASFDFPFKKGKGLPPLVHNLSPKGFSLRYAMIKYDPDERIAAHQALQHPYFQELWKVQEKTKQQHGAPNGELPRLNLSGATKLTSCPTPTLHVFCPPKESGEIPVVRSVRFTGPHMESEKQKALKTSLKRFHLPAIERRGGGY
ncbi:LOW QUALITY PROTEIN: MAPK/MAK/MRK overlapping kinase [Podargus strigoides]